MIPYFIALKQSHQVSNYFGQGLSVAPGRARALVAARLGLARRLFSARVYFALAGDFLGVVAAVRSGAILARALGDFLRALLVGGIRWRIAAGRGQYRCC